MGCFLQSQVLISPVFMYLSEVMRQRLDGPAKLDPASFCRSDAFGFDVLGTVDEYLDICGRWVRYEGASMEITPDMPRHTAVLQYE